MCSHYASSSAPDYGSVLDRPRISRQLGCAGDRFRVLAAASGWGKTVAAAQYAVGTTSEVLWIGAEGQEIPLEVVAAEILARARSAANEEPTRACDIRGHPLSDLLDKVKPALHGLKAKTGKGMLIVVDDLADDESLDSLRLLHLDLRSHGAWLLVTSRTDASGRAGLRDSVVLTESDLGFSEGEALALSGLIDLGDPSTFRETLEACNGHVALFMTMRKAQLSGPEKPVGSRANEVMRQRLETLALDAFGPDDMECLTAAALLKRGTIEQLVQVAGPEAPERFERAARRIPILNVWRAAGAECRASFHVHDFAEDWLLAGFGLAGQPEAQNRLRACCEMMATANELQRASRLVVSYGSESLRHRWLSVWGDPLLASGTVSVLEDLLESLNLHTLMAEPRLLLLWARALDERGNPAHAVDKARASQCLAQQAGDVETAVRASTELIGLLVQLDLGDELLLEAEKLDGLVRDGWVPADLRQEALLAVCRAAVYAGALSLAVHSLAGVVSADDSPHSEQNPTPHMYLAMCRGLAFGEFVQAAASLSALLPGADCWLSDRVTWRGNLAGCLLEAGRLERASQLLEAVLESNRGSDKSAFEVFRGAAAAGRGDYQASSHSFAESTASSVALGHDSDLAVNRCIESAVSRACGDPHAALQSSERAFERLAVVDHLGFRRLAAIEVAANLLALGDVAAARRWVNPLVEAGFGGNEYHALRADLVLAECDFREGDLLNGIARIASHKEHILTESSNWQLAMYARAFPNLLGMLAAAIGPSEIPVHMLRMILPEHAERTLDVCRDWLDHDEWGRLGTRVLGEAEFTRLAARNGRPLCHIRMLGGLEVTIGERVVRERDWRKRKSRLLFAMMASRRGSDIARDQILEALWPEMDEERARNNFYVAWSTMKATLAPGAGANGCPYVESRRGRCHLLRDAVRIDLDDFDDALAALRSADAEQDKGAAIEALQTLSTLYRGDLLSGDLYEDWFSSLRETLRHGFIEAMGRGAELLLALDDPFEAIVYARRAIQADPLREDMYQLTLRAHIAAGQRSAAIETFLQCRSQLAEELGLDPSTSTMALYDHILSMEESPRRDDLGLSDIQSGDSTAE